MRPAPTPRQRILDAARGLLAERGFGETSLRTVAARAGCTTGSVTHHFADREALLVALLRDAHEAAAARMLARAQAARGARARLRVVLDEALPLDVERVREWRVWLAFWAEAVRLPSLAEENARRYEEWRLVLGSLLLPLVRSGQARERAVERLVTLVDGLGVGLLTAGRVRPLPAQVRGARRQVERALGELRR